MSDTSIEKILRESFPPSLPYRFAERVAQTAMSSEEERGSLWDFLALLSPKAGIALGAVAALLTVIGIAGSGPGILEAVQGATALNDFIPLM